MDIEVNSSTINSLMIEGLTNKIPLIDIFILLSKQVNDIKKITFFHDPMNYIASNCKCQIDFENHESLIKAKLILNTQNLNNLFNIKEPKIRISECELNRSNLAKESISKTSALMFENTQINNINILEFIFHLKKFINSNNANDKNKYKITKVRQYSNRILIIFEPNVPENIKKFIQKGENELHPPIPYFNYKGKNIPIIPKMKPVVNLGKYKEKYIKLSAHNLDEEDRENLFAIFEKKQDIKDENLLMSKMAENAFNNILNKEKLIREEKFKKSNNNMINNNLNKKRERERNREKVVDKEKERRERDRDLMNRDKIRDNRNRDMKMNRRDRDIRDNKRERNREYNNRNIMDERREDSSSDRDRKGDNMNINNNYRNNGNNNNFIEENNLINNINNNIVNNNLSGLNINEKDLNQVASLFSNANAVNLVKYLLENNAFNNINQKSNNNQHNINNKINNGNLPQSKHQMQLNDDSNINNNINLLKNNNNNYNEVYNNLYNQTQNPNNINTNVNYQQLLNLLQSQSQTGINNNKINQNQQRINNNNNINNNFQNMMNINQMMKMNNNNNNNNNLLNNNYFNNQRQYNFPLNEQFMNQFCNFNSQQKRKNNENN